MEAGVLFTAEIKLHYLHVIRGAEARHGNNGRPNDGFGIVRAIAGLCRASAQARARCIALTGARHASQTSPQPASSQFHRERFGLACRSSGWDGCCFSAAELASLSRVGRSPCAHPGFEGSWCVRAGCVYVWRVEVTPLRELCPLSCCIYIEISLFVPVVALQPDRLEEPHR